MKPHSFSVMLAMIMVVMLAGAGGILGAPPLLILGKNPNDTIADGFWTGPLTTNADRLIGGLNANATLKLSTNLMPSYVMDNLGGGTVPGTNTPQLNGTNTFTGTNRFAGVVYFAGLYETELASDTALYFQPTSQVQHVTLAHHVSAWMTNFSAGQCLTVILESSNAARGLTFDVNWNWAGYQPTNINAHRTGILSLYCRGSNPTNVYATYTDKP